MNLEINILYEDEYLFIIDKPNNVLVHHSYYARNIEDDSLVQILEKQLGAKLFPINRLDRKTSGIILFTRNKDQVSRFQELFDRNEINKVYHSLLRGHLMESIIIDSPVKNERGNYREAQSIFKPIKHLVLDIPVQPYPTSRYTLAELTPITGRTHQLRIHANKIAHPIIGDHKYGNRHHNRMFEEQLGLPNLFLHSFQTSFVHPFTGKEVMITCEYPDFWSYFFENQLLTVTA